MAVRPHHDPSAYFCSHFLSVFTSSRPLFDAISFAPQVPIKPLLNDVGSQQPTGPFCLCLAFRWHTYLGRSVRAQGAHPALGCHLFMSIEKEMSNLGVCLRNAPKFESGMTNHSSYTALTAPCHIQASVTTCSRASTLAVPDLV